MTLEHGDGGQTKSTSANFLMARDGWLKTVASYPNLSGADMAVAVVLATYLNRQTGTAWPAIETVARDTNRSPSTVWRSLRRLEDLGLVDVVHARGRNKSNRYRPRLGHIDNPDRLRRRGAGKTLRVRAENTASPQLKHCELAVRTSEEPTMN
jgi:hypothetical protein